MRAILLGSSEPGVTALDALRAAGVDVVGVGAHAGELDGAVGASLLAAAQEAGIETAEFVAKERAEIGRFAERLAPDVGFTVGFRYLLDAAALAVPPRGWLNIHSSLLPAYRGRAPVNWAILEGERELGATLHFLDAGVDTGAVVFQESFPLGDDEDAGDALRKLDGVYRSLLGRAVAGLEAGELPRHALSGDDRVWPRRTPEDGRIDWTQPSTNVLRLVRAVAPPYPGAFTSLDGHRLVVLSAEPAAVDVAPGTIAADGSIGCADGAIRPRRVLLDDEQLDSLAPYAGAVCGG